MIKWCSKLYAILINLLRNQQFIASAKDGLNTLANVMIIGNLTTKDPFIKVGEVVLLVPKYAISAARYVLEFFSKHKVLTIPTLALLGYGIFRIIKSQLLKEGINNAVEFVNNLLFFNESVDESDKNLLIEETKKLNSDPIIYERNLGSSPNSVRVNVDLFDFDKSGEISHSEFLKGEKLVRAVRKIDRDILYVLQCVTEEDIDFVTLLKRARVYQYEKNVQNSIY